MAGPGIRRAWRTLAFDNPAVGADWTIKPPGQNIWRIISLVARLATSGVAGNRLPVFIADNGERTWWTVASGQFQIAAQTIDHSLCTGFGSFQTLGSVFVYPFPVQGVLLRPSNRLRVATTALDVADQWSNIMALVEEIPTGIEYQGDELLPITPSELG